MGRSAIAAGKRYDATNSGGTNLGPTNQKLMDRIQADAKSLHEENPSQLVPVDLITTSASGLDPEISPAAAEFQVPRLTPGPRPPGVRTGRLDRKTKLSAESGTVGGPAGERPGTQSRTGRS